LHLGQLLVQFIQRRPDFGAQLIVLNGPVSRQGINLMHLTAQKQLIIANLADPLVNPKDILLGGAPDKHQDNKDQGYRPKPVSPGMVVRRRVHEID
jgi:hypothetical protein